MRLPVAAPDIFVGVADLYAAPSGKDIPHTCIYYHAGAGLSTRPGSDFVSLAENVRRRVIILCICS